MNINDFCVSKLDKTKNNLIVFDDCGSDKDQVIQNIFFKNGRHGKCACLLKVDSGQDCSQGRLRFHHMSADNKKIYSKLRTPP